MSILPCSCTATPLTASGMQSAMDALGIDAPTLWAILYVETHGCGYFSSRRPQILFERHLFHQYTGGKFDAVAPDISNPIPGGYGPGGDSQYARLAAAYALDPEAALQAASWGLGQILGVHATEIGYKSVDDMVDAMACSEDKQLQAVVGFIQHKKLETALQKQQWADYARVYNGSDYAKNQYDTRLQQAYTSFQDTTRRPDLSVRTAQMLLHLLGYDPHGVDGSMGAHTLTALHNFQVDQKLPLTPGINDDVISTLVGALPAATNLSLA